MNTTHKIKSEVVGSMWVAIIETAKETLRSAIDQHGLKGWMVAVVHNNWLEIFKSDGRYQIKRIAMVIRFGNESIMLAIYRSACTFNAHGSKTRTFIESREELAYDDSEWLAKCATIMVDVVRSYDD